MSIAVNKLGLEAIMIIRQDYLNKIKPFIDKDLIKVITGLRRCGKSILLKQIQDVLYAKGITEKQIIYYLIDIY